MALVDHMLKTMFVKRYFGRDSKGRAKQERRKRRKQLKDEGIG